MQFDYPKEAAPAKYADDGVIVLLRRFEFPFLGGAHRIGSEATIDHRRLEIEEA